MGLEKIEGIMIGAVMAIIIITSGIFMLTSFTGADTTLDSRDDIAFINATLDKSVEITDSTNRIKDSIETVTAEDTGVLGWINALIGSVFNGLKSVGSTLDFIGVAATNTASYLGIPPFILPLLTLIIFIIVGFAIWSAITRLS
jgi:hypothetical protein